MRKKPEDMKLEFINRTRNQYIHSSRIDKYCTIKEVVETDGNFLKIGERPQIEREFFDPRSNYIREILGLGANITVGEEKYFISNILNNVNAEEIHETDLTLEFLANQLGKIGPLREIIILAEFLFVKKTLGIEKKWINWDHELNSDVLIIGADKIKLFGINEELIDRNIILLNKNAVIWKYKVDNGERLHIDINKSREPWKYDITVYSIFKQNLDVKKIKVFKIV